MSRSDALEIRTAAAFNPLSSGTLAGYAAVFDAPADLGEFVEVIRPGAFTRTLAGADVRALYDHERQAILGRTPNTLRLSQDGRGLAFELDLPDTTLGRDLRVLVERGDVRGCSFGFRCAEGGDRWELRGERMHRELVDVDLHEITLTAWPAYRETEVVKRSLALATESQGYQSKLVDLWLQTVVIA